MQAYNQSVCEITAGADPKVAMLKYPTCELQFAWRG